MTQPMLDQDADVPPSRAARMRWPIIVTCMLLAHVGAMMLAVKIARSDTSHGINGYQILPETGDESVPFQRAPKGTGARDALSGASR